MASLTVDGDQIARFHAALFKHASQTAYVSLRGFPDTTSGPPYVIDAAVNGSAVAKAITIAQQCANASTPIVFAPPVATFDTPDSAAYAHMVDGLVLSVECDQNPGQSLITLEAILGSATLVVASGGRTAAGEDKLHLHWRLKRPTRQAIEHQKLRQARKAAALLVGADKTNITPVHPIRWPGSYHRKGEPRLTQIITEHDTEIDLDEAFATLETACELAGIQIDPPRAPSTGVSEAPIQDLAAAMALVPNSEETPWDEFNGWGMALYAATGGSADGYAIFDEWASRSPKYDASDVLARWEHYPSSPPTDTGAGKIFAAARAAAPGWREPSRGELMAGFEPVTVDRQYVEHTAPKGGIYALYFDEIMPDFTDDALIDDFLLQGSMSVVYGATNTGKTFVAMDMAHAIACGRPWAGRYVKQGAVVYIAAEGGRGARGRVEALRRKYGGDGIPFVLVPCPVNLMSSKEDARVLVAILAEVEAKHGRIALVVIDTLARALAGANENSSEDMGVFVRNIDQLRATCGAHFMIVHHSGKDTTKGGRGSSALPAAIDTEFEVIDNKLITHKQRDLEKAKPVSFVREIVVLGTNPRGRQVTSCTIRALSDDEARSEEIGSGFDMEPRDQILWTAFLVAMAEVGAVNMDGIRVITSSQWHAYVKQSDVSAFKREDRMPVTEGSYRTATSRARGNLVKSGKVRKINDKEWSL